MSVLVDEICKDIKKNPEKWKPNNNHNGLEKDNVEIFGYGNTKLFSIININVNGKITYSSYTDKWKLESTVIWWYKNCTLSAYKKEN